ncbi:hypothetical protein AA0535_2404 [Asaia krungthepensis NRIC 0535]|uniref:Uncharacterized protein n=1 Tax=Asaia krungthepensis NRIC 0535 TaxID=1307925 RepID=A0ABQ0Q555_9PROT|nr:hypothetical protein AA0535_2404 [Asaia krungthepensis NRIC 0535]
MFDLAAFGVSEKRATTASSKFEHGGFIGMLLDGVDDAAPEPLTMSLTCRFGKCQVVGINPKRSKICDIILEYLAHTNIQNDDQSVIFIVCARCLANGLI